MRFPRWRKMTWVILLFSVVMLIWVIAAASTVADTNVTAAQRADCEAQVAEEFSLYDSVEECVNTLESAGDLGGGIGTALIIILWLVGFFVLSIIWFMTRPKTRMCPRCGNDVKKGLTACNACGFEFGRAPESASTST